MNNQNRPLPAEQKCFCRKRGRFYLRFQGVVLPAFVAYLAAAAVNTEADFVDGNNGQIFEIGCERRVRSFRAAYPFVFAVGVPVRRLAENPPTRVKINVPFDITVQEGLVSENRP